MIECKNNERNRKTFPSDCACHFFFHFVWYACSGVPCKCFPILEGVSPAFQTHVAYMSEQWGYHLHQTLDLEMVNRLKLLSAVGRGHSCLPNIDFLIVVVWFGSMSLLCCPYILRFSIVECARLVSMYIQQEASKPHSTACNVVPEDGKRCTPFVFCFWRNEMRNEPMDDLLLVSNPLQLSLWRTNLINQVVMLWYSPMIPTPPPLPPIRASMYVAAPRSCSKALLLLKKWVSAPLCFVFLTLSSAGMHRGRLHKTSLTCIISRYIQMLSALAPHPPPHPPTYLSMQSPTIQDVTNVPFAMKIVLNMAGFSK